MPGQLLQKEGIAPRLRHDRLELRLREEHGTQRRLDDGPALLGAQGRHDDLRHRNVRPPGGLISWPIGPQEQYGGLCHPLHQRRQPARRGGIAPVQVFYHQDEGPLLRGGQEQMPQQRKGPGLPPLGAALCQGRRGDGEIQELEQQGHVGVRRHATRVQPLLHGGRVDRRRVALHEPAHLLQKITHQQVGGTLAVRQTLPRIHRHLVPRHAAAEFGQQPGLAHARFPHEAHHLALPRSRCSQVVVEPRQLPPPPHKGTLVPHAPPCHPRMAPHEPLHRIDGHGRGTAVHRQGAAGGDSHLRVHQVVGGGTQKCPGRRPLLEPQGQVRRGAHPSFKAEDKEGGDDQAEKPVATFWRFPQPRLRVAVSTLNRLEMAMHAAFGKSGATSKLSNALLTVFLNRVENQKTFGPQSHVVGPCSEGWLKS